MTERTPPCFSLSFLLLALPATPGEGAHAGLGSMSITPLGVYLPTSAAPRPLLPPPPPLPALPYGKYLAAPPLALRGPLDDPWQIQQLDLGLVVVDDAGDAGQGGELVRRYLRLRPGEQAEQGRLAHGWEAWESTNHLFVQANHATPG